MVATPPLSHQYTAASPDAGDHDEHHAVTTHPTVEAHPIAVRQPLAMAMARRAVPLVAAAASAALTTLAVERAVANFALRSIERTPFGRRSATTDFTRITVTRTTVVEHISRPS
ncbi:MAG: hypothetical protein O2924_00390 [Chloroflexi bacterium]|nr:hypothetical protein [Chloroflexota bacterium]MQC17133.1 hypothetical protein [Chloroflexota bacterium]